MNDSSVREIEMEGRPPSFILEPTIGDEDRLSRLPELCILHVFSMLTLDDLDEMCTTSQTMYKFALLDRPKARKARHVQLRIVSTPTRKLSVMFRGDKQSYEIAAHRDDWNNQDPINVMHPTVQRIFEIASRFLKRYDFGRVYIELDYVRMDSYLDQLRRNIILNKPDLLYLEVSFENQPDLSEFKDWIVAAKAREVCVTAWDIDRIVSADFIEQLANTVPKPSLELAEKGWWTHAFGIPNNKFIFDVFARFVDFSVLSAIIQTNRFMDLVIKRYDKKCLGHWHVRTTGHLDSSTIESGLLPGMETEHLKREQIAIRFEGRVLFTIRTFYPLLHHSIMPIGGWSREEVYEATITFH